MKAKPVLGSDDLLLLLTHHWGRDTNTFPTEEQRLALATAMLLLIYTGCRPAELVDGSKRRKGTKRTRQSEEDDRSVLSLDKEEYTNDRCDPVYDQADPWLDQANSDYVDDKQSELEARDYNALCYEDVRLWVVQNPTVGERDLLAMEITFAHHKGADRRPKP